MIYSFLIIGFGNFLSSNQYCSMTQCSRHWTKLVLAYDWGEKMVSVPILMAGSEKQNHPIRQVFSNVDNDNPISDLKTNPF